MFGSVVLRSFFGATELPDIEGQSIFKFFHSLVDMNYRRSISVFPFILGGSFHKYNLRQIDRDTARRLQQFKRYSCDMVAKICDSVEQRREELMDRKQQGQCLGVI